MIAPASPSPAAKKTTVPCVHCGLPSPPSDNGPAFCCEGCRGAYALIHEWQLEDYYALRDQLGGKSSRPDSIAADIALLDQPDLHGDALRLLDDGSCSVTLAIDGVHCGACAWLIERAVPLVSGWQTARVNLPRREVEVTFAPEKTRLSRIAHTLSTFGYRLRPVPEAEDDSADIADRKARWRRLAVAGFCFANAMWIAIALYAARDGAIEPQHALYLTLFGTALAAVSVLGPGAVFLRSALAAIRTRTPHIDLPVSLGLIAGLIGSLVSVTFNVGETYFDSLCGLVFFLLLGRELQARGQQRATSAVRALASLRPPIARRVEGNTTRTVRVKDLIPGDIVDVLPGEVVPIDGIVVDGNSHTDQSILTGESVPVAVARGSKVAAGVRNLERSIRLRVEATAGQTRVAAISRLVEESLASRTPLVQLADKIGGVFVLIILAVAVLTFAMALTATSTLDAGQRAVALLVVACPCALALATPLAIGVAVGRAAKRGILIRRGDVFERLTHPGTVWFDKTGTLTAGRPTLAVWNGTDATLALAAAVEQESQHPVATCIVAAARERDVDQWMADEIEVRRRGVVGEVRNHRVAVGSRRFLDDMRITVPPVYTVQGESFAARGMTPNFVAVDGEVEAVFAIADQLRPDAADTVRRFRDAGWNVGILSGDHRDVVASIASQLGLPQGHAHGELTPEEKLATVRDADRAGSVVFVGDGVNDAAALAAADVGIATSGAAEASLQAASIYSPGPLADLPTLLSASGQTVRGIRRLLAVSLTYNICAGIAAILGVITPLIAAVLMPVSSLTVTLMAFAVQTFPRRPRQPVRQTPVATSISTEAVA